jgi:hypothetical protein
MPGTIVALCLLRIAGLVLALSTARGFAQDAPRDEETTPWVLHNSFEHFRQGSFGDGGTNLYAAASGAVEMIHRWDLNNDGFLDLAVGQSHNTTDNEDLFIYWGAEGGPRSLMPPLPQLQPLGRLLHQVRLREKTMTRLPSDGGGQSLLVDLNGDGWKEVVFCNFIHNHATRQDAYIYWGSPDGYDANKLTRLPTLHGLAVAAADFNRDGFIDLCFANNGSEMGGRFDYDQHLESYIYFNGPRGFDEQRRVSIPSVSATDCAAGDIKGDGNPALVLLNSHPDERSLFIYWNSKDGFSSERREVRRIGRPVGVELIDVNGDDRADLIVFDAANLARIYLGSEQGLGAEPSVELPVLGAKSCRAADLNGDQFIDLVIPNPGTPTEQLSYIYWGAAGGGFAKERRTELPTSWASDAAVADFNGDGLGDVAFANERDEFTYDTNSYIYFNGPEGFHPARRSDLQGLGPVSALADDLNRDGRQDLVLINRYSGWTAANKTSPPALIYWGNAAHHYSPAAMATLPTNGDCHAVADLDQNGFVDIVFPNGHIYYGGERGDSVERRLDLQLQGYGVSVADLNRDGYLDLLIPTAAKGLILWGGPQGHRRDRLLELPLTTRITQAASIADLNKDDHLDLIFPDVDSPRVDFYWGDASGSYEPKRRTSMDVHSASIVAIADVNQDVWLDLVFGGTYDRKNKGRHAEHGVLLFGGADGFSLERSQRFEAFDSDEQVVADLNKDGHLDLVVSNYHGHTTRSIPTFIYWGDASGRFHESRRATLPGESTLRLTVLDLNQDGWLDITAFDHQRSGDHTAGANIFWGAEEGFREENRQSIAAFGVHFGERRNLGNIYDRTLEETYISPELTIPPRQKPTRLSWRAQTPRGTSVAFQVRSAESNEKLGAAVWRGLDGDNSRFTITPAELNVPAEHRVMQYRAILRTPDGGGTASLTEVRIVTEAAVPNVRR